MQLIIHDKAKNAIKYLVQAPDKYGSAHFFQNEPLVFYPVLTLVVSPPVSIVLTDSHKSNSS